MVQKKKRIRNRYKENTVSLMVKTAIFPMTKILLLIALAVPYIFLVKIALDMADAYVGGYWAFRLAYVILVVLVWYTYREIIADYLLYIISAAHMYVVSQYLTRRSDSMSIIDAIIGSIRHVGSIHVLYAIKKVLEEKAVDKLLVQINNSEALDIGMGLPKKLVSHVTKVALGNISTSVLCYVYVNEDDSIMESITEGTLFYMKSWESVLKSSFVILFSSMIVTWGLRATFMGSIIHLLLTSPFYVSVLAISLILLLMDILEKAIGATYVYLVVLRGYLEQVDLMKKEGNAGFSFEQFKTLFGILPANIFANVMHSEGSAKMKGIDSIVNALEQAFRPESVQPNQQSKED